MIETDAGSLDVTASKKTDQGKRTYADAEYMHADTNKSTDRRAHVVGKFFFFFVPLLAICRIHPCLKHFNAQYGNEQSSYLTSFVNLTWPPS